jgi:hypothetical protein
MTSSLKVLCNRSFAQDGQLRKAARMADVRPMAHLNRNPRLV